MNKMSKINFKSPNEFILENGSSEYLPNILLKKKLKNALIITDEVLVDIGTIDSITKNLDVSNINFTVYKDVPPEPPVESVYEALKVYKDNNCDVIIGIGGGSPLDVAKAVAMLVTNPGKYEDYAGVNRVPNKSSPLILIPTTSGTGSEVSMFSIMIVNGSKVGVVDPNIVADVALVDPLLTISVPRHVTAATGLDALCHHIESYISMQRSPFCSNLCLEGIRVISKYLRRAFGNGNDQEARYWLSYASSLGGFVMNLTGGAAANHGLAFALGAKFGVGHGLSNAVMLPYVFPIVGLAEIDRIEDIALAMNLNTINSSSREILNLISNELTTLVRDLNCLIPLSDFGVTKNDIDLLVDETLTQVRVLNNSSYQLSRKEIKSIFEQAL